MYCRIPGSAGRDLREEDPRLLVRLGLVGLFRFWAVPSMWLYSWLLSTVFLTKIAFKTRQAAENSGEIIEYSVHCKGRSLWLRKIQQSWRSTRDAQLS
jgi:hypothetical protein